MNRDTDSIKQSDPIPSSIHLNTLESRTGVEAITYGKVSQKLRSNTFLEIMKFSLDHYSCLFMFYVLIVKVEDSVCSNN